MASNSPDITDTDSSDDSQSTESSIETSSSEMVFCKSGANLRPEDLSPHEIAGVRYGKCKWFNVAKGWGFLIPHDGGHEVFVHQTVIKMTGFRSLGEKENVEFECHLTERGLEASRVSGIHGSDCHGSTFRPRTKKRHRRVRCYNCGEFANHIASKCHLGPQPKRCHLCKKEGHLFANCPTKMKQPNEPDAPAHTSAANEPDASAHTSAANEPDAPAHPSAANEPEAPAHTSAANEPDAPAHTSAANEPDAPAHTSAANEPDAPAHTSAANEPDAPAHTSAANEDTDDVGEEDPKDCS